MTTDDGIPQKLRDRVAASGFDKVVKFDCGADGVIVINKTEVTRQDMPADMTLTLSQKNLEKLIRGKLNPMTGVMTGKLKVSGDARIAMKLGELLKS